ncbi:MAG: DNA topoisomerase I, partial [Candidatus Aenigmatarchaeota archaeon]
KFSTLTTSELQESYNSLMDGMDKGQVEAGLTRHKLDWLWGINSSRALTLAVKNSGGGFKVLSTGRVQGPALKILAEREKEIQDFEPEPYWEIEADLKGEKENVRAEHEEGKFWKEEEAKKVQEKCEGGQAEVSNVKRNRYKWGPFPPFDLTTLQTEAYSAFGINPSTTLDIAQSLYDQGLISYPRTSSQKLPPKIGYKNILKKIKNQNKYEKLAQKILNKSKIYPRQGKKKDAAHPAIHPTGMKPKSLRDNEKKLYDLIVKRFISTFGDPSIRESMKIKFDINGEIFQSKGKRVIEKNWIELYEPYVRFKEQILPDLEKGELLEVFEVEMLEKETKPPNRYSQASLVKKLQKKSLGTKATRSQIVKTLFNRGYINGKKIKVTELGLSVVDTLEKYSPEILSEDLTREFEEEMKSIREGDNKKEKVIEEAEKTLKEIFENFKDKEKKIGEELGKALKKTRKDRYRLGKCPECGNYLRIIKSKKNGKRFVGCEGYKEEGCENTYPLPQYGKIVSTDKVCESCGTPIIKVIRKGKRPWKLCLDPDCETKDDWNKKKKD